MTPSQIYLTAADVAELIGVSPRTVLGWHQGRPGAPGFPAPCKYLLNRPRWRRSVASAAGAFSCQARNATQNDATQRTITLGSGSTGGSTGGAR